MMDRVIANAQTPNEVLTDAYLYKGMAAAQQNRASKEAFAAAHALSPTDDRATYNLGTVLLARRRHSEAIELLRPLSEREDPHDAAVFNLAEAYRATGALESARDLLRSLVERHPSFKGVSFALGVTLEALGDLAGAEAAYRSALDQRGDDLASLLNLASVLERLGRIGEARALLERALELPMEEERSRAIREAIRALASGR
jgi:tetratricopeptide (TPR) repeat protein